MTVEYRGILNSLDEDAVSRLLMLTPAQVLDTSSTVLTRKQLVAGILLRNATVQTGSGARGVPLMGDLRRQLLFLVTANVGTSVVVLSRVYDTHARLVVFLLNACVVAQQLEMPQPEPRCEADMPREVCVCM